MAKEDVKKILGLGSFSMHKSYYKDLKDHQIKLEQFGFALDNFHCPIVFFDPVNLIIVDKNETFSSFFENEKTFRFLTDIFLKKDQEEIKKNLTEKKPKFSAKIKKDNKKYPFEITIRMTSFRGKKVGVCLFYDISERLKYENEIKENEAKYRSLYHYSETTLKQLEFVINKSETLMVAIDKFGKIIESNITRFEPFKKPLKDKNIFKDELPEYYDEIKKLAHSASVYPTKKTIEIRDERGQKYIFSFIIKKFYNKTKNEIASIIYGNDLTNYKDNHEILLPGNAYVHMEVEEDNLINILKDFSTEYKVFYISRNNGKADLDFGEMIELKVTKDPLEEVHKKIRDKIRNNKKCIFYFQRLDFLRCFGTFQELMKLVFTINDIVKESKNIVVYSVKKSIFTESEIEHLQNECFLFTLDNSTNDLDPRKLTILRLISSEKNAMNCTQISRKTGISRKTIIDWTKELELKGLAYFREHGRGKYLRITDKGKKEIGL